MDGAFRPPEMCTVSLVFSFMRDRGSAAARRREADQRSGRERGERKPEARHQIDHRPLHVCLIKPALIRYPYRLKVTHSGLISVSA
jgi:hypothetical protein